jgi:hypothetical protein
MSDKDPSNLGPSVSSDESEPKMGKLELIYLLAMAGIWSWVTVRIISGAGQPLAYVSAVLGSALVGYSTSFALEVARSWQMWKGSLRRVDRWFGIVFMSLGILTMLSLLLDWVAPMVAVALTSVWVGFFVFQYLPHPVRLERALARLVTRLLREG